MFGVFLSFCLFENHQHFCEMPVERVHLVLVMLNFYVVNLNRVIFDYVFV